MRGGRTVTKRARILRGRPTDAELRLWYFPRRNQFGFRFRRQFPIGPYFVDFASVDARLIVEADGGQHAAPVVHDRRDAFLINRGWRVLRFWNNDVLQNPEGVLRIVGEALEFAVQRSRSADKPGCLPPPQPSPVATGEGETRSGSEGAGTTLRHADAQIAGGWQ